MGNEVVSVSVQLRTKITGGENEQVIESIADGRLYYKEQGLYLQFKEEMEEVGIVNQIVKVEGNDTLTIIRQGAVSMKQLFQQGKKTEGVYRSQFGPMMMNTNTTHMQFDVDQKANVGKIHFSYQLHMQDEFAGNYDVTITYRRN